MCSTFPAGVITIIEFSCALKSTSFYIFCTISGIFFDINTIIFLLKKFNKMFRESLIKIFTTKMYCSFNRFVLPHKKKHMRLFDLCGRSNVWLQSENVWLVFLLPILSVPVMNIIFFFMLFENNIWITFKEFTISIFRLWNLRSTPSFYWKIGFQIWKSCW